MTVTHTAHAVACCHRGCLLISLVGIEIFSMFSVTKDIDVFPSLPLPLRTTTTTTTTTTTSQIKGWATQTLLMWNRTHPITIPPALLNFTSPSCLSQLKVNRGSSPFASHRRTCDCPSPKQIWVVANMKKKTSHT